MPKPRTRRKSSRPYQLVVVLDADDLALVEKATAQTKSTKADLVRRALRAYARLILANAA